MYGFEAITASNGWAMAVAGVIIVFSGLIVLSLTIAQLHKVLNFWEDRGSFYHRLNNAQPKKAVAGKTVAELDLPPELSEPARHLKLITHRLGEPFSLPKLLELAELSGIYHPHATTNRLIKSGFILPDGKGYFVWKR